MITYQGVQQGFFADEGLDVEITWTRGGAETLQAVTTGSVDFAMANGILGVLGAFAKGAPVRIVGAESTGAADLFWYAKTDSGISSMADTTGKTVGYSRPGSSTNLTVLALAQDAGVKPKLVSTGGISGTRTQVMSDQVDVGWSVPPFNLDMVERGEIRIVARGSDLPELANQTVRVNVVNADFNEQNPELVKRFMRAYKRTVDWMYDNPQAALDRYAEFNGIDMAVAKSAIKFYPKSALKSEPVAGIELSMEQAVEFDRLAEPLSETQLDTLILVTWTAGTK